MAKRSQENDRQNRAAKRRDDNLKRGAQTEGHRLRGGELDADFADAESDSSVVTSRRDEKQSDS